MNHTGCPCRYLQGCSPCLFQGIPLSLRCFLPMLLLCSPLLLSRTLFCCHNTPAAMMLWVCMPPCTLRSVHWFSSSIFSLRPCICSRLLSLPCLCVSSRVCSVRTC